MHMERLTGRKVGRRFYDAANTSSFTNLILESLTKLQFNYERKVGTGPRGEIV